MNAHAWWAITGLASSTPPKSAIRMAIENWSVGPVTTRSRPATSL